MSIRTNLGQIEVTQDDFTDNGLPVVREGVNVTVLTGSSADTRELWEIRVGDQVLASYDEIAASVRTHCRWFQAFGSVAAALSILSAAWGVRLRMRLGTWGSKN